MLDEKPDFSCLAHVQRCERAADSRPKWFEGFSISLILSFI
jgi:hypothetical protein